jgi:hypothetical protein
VEYPPDPTPLIILAPADPEPAPRQPRSLHDKFNGFLDRNQTAFGKQEQKAAEKVQMLREAIKQDQQERPERPALSEIFGSATRTIGAISNLGLGAAAVPEGLAIVSSSKCISPWYEKPYFRSGPLKPLGRWT